MPTTDDRLIAGMVSTSGLVTLFGDSTEKANGVMTILSANDWVARINSSSYKTTGPTGAWAGEWWSVYNYLQYGGVCKILTSTQTQQTKTYFNPWSGNSSYQKSYDVDVLFGTKYTTDNLFVSTENNILYFVENKKQNYTAKSYLVIQDISTNQTYNFPQFSNVTSNIKKLSNNINYLTGKHSCYIKSDGTVVCFGDNSSGQCNVPAGLTDVKQVSCGALHTMALKTNGTVVGWGNNGDGQITPPGGLVGVKQVTCGNNHTCLLKSDGTVVCFGRDTFSSNESVSLGKILGTDSDGKGITSTSNNLLGTAVRVGGITLTNINYIDAVYDLGYSTIAYGGPRAIDQTQSQNGNTFSDGYSYQWGGTRFSTYDSVYSVRNGVDSVSDNIKINSNKSAHGLDSFTPPILVNTNYNGPEYFSYYNYLINKNSIINGTVFSTDDSIFSLLNIEKDINIIDAKQKSSPRRNSYIEILGSDNKIYYNNNTSFNNTFNIIKGSNIISNSAGPYLNNYSIVNGTNENNSFITTFNNNNIIINYTNDIRLMLYDNPKLSDYGTKYITDGNLLVCDCNFSFNSGETPNYGQCLGTTFDGSIIVTDDGLTHGEYVKINGITLTGCQKVFSSLTHTLVLKTDNTLLGFGKNDNGECLGTTGGGALITDTPSGQLTKINGITLTSVRDVHIVDTSYSISTFAFQTFGCVVGKTDYTIQSWGQVQVNGSDPGAGSGIMWIQAPNKNIIDINTTKSYKDPVAGVIDPIGKNAISMIAMTYNSSSSQNLVQFSEEYNTSRWTLQNGLTISNETKTNGLGGVTSIKIGSGLTANAAVYQPISKIGTDPVGYVLNFWALSGTLNHLSCGLYFGSTKQFNAPSNSSIISGTATIVGATSSNISLVGITALNGITWSNIQVKFPEVAKSTDTPTIIFYPGIPGITNANKNMYISNIQLNEGSESYSYTKTTSSVYENLNKEVINLFTGEKINLPDNTKPVSLNNNKNLQLGFDISKNYILLDNGKIYNTYDQDYLAINDFITSFYYKDGILVYNTTNNKENITAYIGNSFINEDYACIFPEQKVITNPWSATDNPVVSVSSDAAGCLARNYATEKKWSPFSGINRGKLLNSVNIQSNSNPLLTPTVKTTSLNEPYFDINKTFSEKSLNTQFTYSQIQKRLNNAFIKYKFELNTEETRLSLANDAKSVLDIVKNENGLTSYVVVCNETNNTQTTISQGNIIVDITINFFGTIETVTYQVSINNETIDIFNT